MALNIQGFVDANMHYFSELTQPIWETALHQLLAIHLQTAALEARKHIPVALGNRAKGDNYWDANYIRGDEPRSISKNAELCGYANYIIATSVLEMAIVIDQILVRSGIANDVHSLNVSGSGKTVTVHFKEAIQAHNYDGTPRQEYITSVEMKFFDIDFYGSICGDGNPLVLDDMLSVQDVTDAALDTEGNAADTHKITILLQDRVGRSPGATSTIVLRYEWRKGLLGLMFDAILVLGGK